MRTERVALRRPIVREDGCSLTHIEIRCPETEDVLAAFMAADDVVGRGRAHLARLTGLQVAEIVRLSDHDLRALGRAHDRLSAGLL